MANYMWAIDLRNSEYGPDRHFAGWLWFDGRPKYQSKEGYVGSATFPTRYIARECLLKVKRSFPKAKVIKVQLVEVKP